MPSYSALAPANLLDYGDVPTKNPLRTIAGMQAALPPDIGIGIHPPGSPANASALDITGVDYPILQAGTGALVSAKTGQPWTSSRYKGFPTTNTGTNPATPGAADSKPIDPNDPAQRYQAVNIVKDPELASSTDALLKTFNDTAASSFKGFADYLNEFKNQTKTATATSAAAADTSRTQAALRADQQKFAGALDKSAANYQDLNAQDAAAQKAILDQAKGILPQYDTAAQNIADRQLQELVKQVGRYKMGTGTPTSLGSSEERILNRGAADVLLPLEQNKIARQYDLLQNLALPIQRDITNRETNRISQFDPMVAGQEFQSSQGVELAIQNLKQASATQNWDLANKILSIPALADEVKNRILAGDTSLLGAISQLRSSTRYQGLQDRLGVTPSQPIAFNLATPALPQSNRYSALGQTFGLNAPNAPRDVGGQRNPADEAYKNQTGYYPEEDPNFSNDAYQRIKIQLGMGPRYSVRGKTPADYGGKLAGATYDPLTNAWIDQQGNIVQWGDGGPTEAGVRATTAAGDIPTSPYE